MVSQMNKKTLKQYRALGGEISLLEKSIEKSRERLANLPVYSGKVQSSEKDYPFIRISTHVPMTDPKETEFLEKLIRTKESRLDEKRRLRIKIETFIDEIDDSTDRQIFEMVFIEGMTYREVGDIMGMEFSNIGKRIRRNLSTNSTK